ncbi:MAG: TonB-dependent receptor [Fusobacterium sp.]|nr:TonB-dependent receptor [Fusobacterium sp.]
MKKLALVLGSLLVVGTAASAKEVVPAPVVVPEKVVEVVEKPVIVYRDREVAPAWRPNGSVDVQYRWYGETENKTVKDDTDKDWAKGENNYGRLQTTTNINFTEKQNLNVRTRNFQELGGTSHKDSTRDTDEIRVRHHYKFGTLGSSKVDATSRLEYRQWEDGKKRVAASVGFDFADYFFSNDYFKVDKFTLRPIYKYVWSGNNGNYSNEYGVDLETYFSLPFGFAFEFNAYNKFEDYNKKIETTKGLKGREFKTSVEAYLYQQTNLYKNGNFAINFDFDGGYDTYNFRQHRAIKNGKVGERRSYELYALPSIGFTYSPTDFISLYANVGAEYRNWKVTAESKAKNWRWQPTAWAGMKVTF